MLGEIPSKLVIETMCISIVIELGGSELRAVSP